MTTNDLLKQCRSALAQIKQRSDCQPSVGLATETLKLFPEPDSMSRLNDSPTCRRPPIQPDDLISLVEATIILPRKQNGKRTHVSTILRWGQSGRITLYQCNGWKVSETELRSKFKPQPVRYSYTPPLRKAK